MKNRIVTAAQMKEIERAGNAHGLPYLQMMETPGWPPTPSCGRTFRWAGRCSSSAARATTAETAL